MSIRKTCDIEAVFEASESVGIMLPGKVFIGIDCSGTPGFLERKQVGRDNSEKEEEWFTIAAVLTHDFASAERAKQELNNKVGDKKGNKLHSKFDKIIEILLNYPLRYYVLVYNKYECPISFAKRWQEFSTSDSPRDRKYKPLVKKFSMHGWLTVDSLIKAQYKGDVEIRMHEDLHGPAWEQYEMEVRAHVMNHISKDYGNCDIVKMDDSYPLIRIADIISNNARYQAKKKILENNVPKIFSRFKPYIVRMSFQVNHVGGTSMIAQPVDCSKFFPWQTDLFQKKT